MTSGCTRLPLLVRIPASVLLGGRQASSADSASPRLPGWASRAHARSALIASPSQSRAIRRAAYRHSGLNLRQNVGGCTPCGPARVWPAQWPKASPARHELSAQGSLVVSSIRLISLSCQNSWDIRSRRLRPPRPSCNEPRSRPGHTLMAAARAGGWRHRGPWGLGGAGKTQSNAGSIVGLEAPGPDRSWHPCVTRPGRRALRFWPGSVLGAERVSLKPNRTSSTRFMAGSQGAIEETACAMTGCSSWAVGVTGENFQKDLKSYRMNDDRESPVMRCLQSGRGSSALIPMYAHRARGRGSPRKKRTTAAAPSRRSR